MYKCPGEWQILTQFTARNIYLTTLKIKFLNYSKNGENLRITEAYYYVYESHSSASLQKSIA